MRAKVSSTLFAAFTVMTASQAVAEKLDFNRDIRPILSDNCFSCHGFDVKHRKAGLRLDMPEAAYEIKDGVQAVKPGDPAASEIIKRILTTDEDEIMPPPDSHKKLSAKQIETLKQWVAEGAPYKKHWSFEPPVKPPVPPTSNLKFEISNSIDAFVRAELQKRKLAPSPEAKKEELIRRVTFDLTGLPPTIAEVDAFLADTGADAYERVVERLLKSQRYGEHMARYWLDAARYADTHGLHLDNERSMWPYRDWVVRAFNQNLPYDQFTIWQLAGDLLPNATVEQQIASGFNRCNVTTSEGGSIAEEWVFRYAVDRTDTTMAVWMGLTAGCAVCHDHKFDPITQKDFYSMYAFFNSAADPAMDGNILLTPPILRLADDDQKKKLAEYEKDIADAQVRIKEAIAKLNYVDPATLSTAPAVVTSEQVWFEDAFPSGVKPDVAGAPTAFVSKGQGPVFSGNAALKRTAEGVAQDYFTSGASFEIPPNGKIATYCYIEPENQPKAVMLQFHTGGWNHRAVWGEEGAIPFGQVRTPEKVTMGKLPEAGQWVKLEVAAERLGLKPGMKVTGYAFTQFGGTVYWDRMGISSRVEPAKDPQWSWKVWVEKNQGKRVAELPYDLQTLVRGKKAAEWPEADLKRLKEWWFENEYQGAREIVAGVRGERLALESKKKALEEVIPATFIMADMPEKRDAFVMERGQYDKPGEKVMRRTPEVFPGLPKQADYTRLDLAKWLMSEKNPLTARVAVNRFWQQFFGLGLVKTSNDFGSQGEPPSHPELLDWMAITFRESGWDVKALVKMIVCSSTYRQSAKASSASLAADPENRWLSHAPRFRLDAEAIRDTALFTSGLLSPKIGGKGVKPYQPSNIWEPVGFGGSNTRNYVQDKGESLYRRSLYTFIKRTAPAPNMVNFDATARESYCLRRERSNTPLQALNLMNDVQFVEAARHLAQRVLKEGGASFDTRINHVWRTVIGRIPTPWEVETVKAAHDLHLAKYSSNEEAAKQLTTFGESPVDTSLPARELAAWTLTASLVLNLDEAVVK